MPAVLVGQPLYLTSRHNSINCRNQTYFLMAANVWVRILPDGNCIYSEANFATDQTLQQAYDISLQMRKAKIAYKKAIRIMNAQGDCNVSNKLNDLLLSKDLTGFWHTWNSKIGN